MEFKFLPLVVLAAAITGCSSSPYAPANQTTPIRQMDSFFSGGRTDYQTPPSGYRYGRGYNTGRYSNYDTGSYSNY
jgi:hypothetical protein